MNSTHFCSPGRTMDAVRMNEQYQSAVQLMSTVLVKTLECNKSKSQKLAIRHAHTSDFTENIEQFR